MFTILKLTIKILLTVQIFNWMLAEIDMLAPGTKDLALSTLAEFQIPTHDKLIENGLPAFEELGKQLDSFIAEAHADEHVDKFQSKAQFNLNSLISDVRSISAQDIKYIAVNHLPVNPVEVFSNPRLIKALNAERSGVERF